MRHGLIALLLAMAACSAPPQPVTRSPAADQRSASRASESVWLEDMTSPELAARIAGGATTAIIPVGGVEQSGPVIALGKHDARVRALADRIAEELGDAVVAPVVSYVPEGDIDPPTGHMRYPGTLSVSPETFRALLATTAESLRHSGFRHVVLIGDHGGYQSDLKAVADALNQRWAGSGAEADYVQEYYGATQGAYLAALRARGFGAHEIGQHAGLADASLSLALDPADVRLPLPAGPLPGVSGDPRRASAQLGRLGADAIVRQTVSAIRLRTGARP